MCLGWDHVLFWVVSARHSHIMKGSSAPPCVLKQNCASILAGLLQTFLGTHTCMSNVFVRIFVVVVLPFQDYSVPEISLFPEENAEGKKVTFRDTSEDSRIFGFPVRANSIIINAGLWVISAAYSKFHSIWAWSQYLFVNIMCLISSRWLVFAEPFFQGVPRVLEVGGFPTPASWGVTHPYVGSLHPLKIVSISVSFSFLPMIP